MLLSSTAYSDASACLKRYQYRWVDKLINKPKDLGVPLRRGIWIHKCLEDYHQGKNWAWALDIMRDWALEHGVDETKVQEVRNEVLDIMHGYIDYWQGKQHWEVLGAEIPIKMMFNANDGIRATTDLAVVWEGQDWLVEHKSTGEIPPASWRAVDPQTALQYWLCHATKPIIGGREFLPVGIIFNYLLTKVPSVPRWKKDGTLYANATPTTAAAFRKGAQAAMDAAPGSISWADLDADAEKLTNDSLFYRRFPVERPEGNVRTSMRDLVQTLVDLKAAEQAGWYRRSLHVLTCRRFCSYADLCIHEYAIGKESPVLREELFMIEDGTRGEGR